MWIYFLFYRNNVRLKKELCTLTMGQIKQPRGQVIDNFLKIGLAVVLLRN